MNRNDLKGITVKQLKEFTLVYFGAGWDFKPVNNPLYKKINHFIFIDSLPNLSHYEKGQAGYAKSKDKETFINTLKQYAKKVGFELTDIKNNLLTFTKGGIILEYYFNTTVEEALNNSYIRKKINKALWTHIKGFNPFEYGLKIGDLPNILENRSKLREL